MLKIRKILLPVEFHETSLRILAVAGCIARRFKSEIVLVHVIAPESYSSRDWKDGKPMSGAELLPDLLDFAEKQLGEPARRDLEGLPVKCLVLQGDASEQIVAAADDSVDLIVMSTHGRTGFFSRLIGSMTMKVMYDSDKPVLTGSRLHEVPTSDPSRAHVLCGVTFSEHSRTVLSCASKIAAEFQAKLTIAHVTPNVELYGPGGMYVDRNWKDDLYSSSQDLIDKLCKDTGAQGATEIASGNPGVELAKIAQKVGADLLVAGCHSSGGHLGSNGYGILAESQIPVLSV